jgi:hypothetical protein
MRTLVFVWYMGRVENGAPYLVSRSAARAGAGKASGTDTSRTASDAGAR